VATELAGEPAVFGGFSDVAGHCGWIVAGDERRPAPLPPGGHVDFYRLVLAALAEPDAVTRQAAMPVDPWDAVATAEVIDAARVSAATGTSRPVGQHNGRS
jgi:hypothetical protein